MNIFKKWKEKREQRRRNDDAVDRACEAKRREAIVNHISEFKTSSADAGFRFFGWTTFDDTARRGHIKAVTQRGDIIEITIYHKGAIHIEQITHEHTN